MPRELAQVKRRIGERLKARRRELRVSQEDLAFRAEITPSYLSQVEAGLRNPSVDILFRLAGALKLEVKDLF